MTSRATLRRACVAAVILLGIAVASADARADGPGDAGAQVALGRKLTEEGLALYSAREYRRAVEKFMAAYAMDPDPNLLFNSARCYEQLGDARAAIDKYEAFLSEPGGDPHGRRKAEEALASLRRAMSAAAKSTGESRPSSAHAEPATTVGESTAPPWSTLGWISLGVGVASGVAGTVLFLSGKADQDQVTGTPGFGQAARMQVAGITQASAQDLVDRGNTKKVLGEVAWGVGGAGLVGALVFFLLDRGTGERRTALGVAPSLDGCAIMAVGRF